jgi:predicted RNase H-like HicB family nuclease
MASELTGCHAQAKSLDALLERTRKAVQLCLEVLWKESEMNWEVPLVLYYMLQRFSITREVSPGFLFLESGLK